MGCRFVPLEMNVKGLNPLHDYRLMQRFKRIFRTEAPDVVLSYTIKNNLFGAMAARACGIPFIPNVTGLGTAFLSGGALQRLAEFLYRRAFRGLKTVFFQNTDDRNLFIVRQLVTAEQATILPGSGIDLEDFPAAPYPAGENETRFLLIARLLRDKGIHEYIDAARRLKVKVFRRAFSCSVPQIRKTGPQSAGRHWLFGRPRASWNILEQHRMFGLISPKPIALFCLLTGKVRRAP